MTRVSKIAVVGLLILAGAPSIYSSERAVLRNGFTLVHDHREVKSGITRLYLSPTDQSFVDVPSDQITDYEKLSPEEEAALLPVVAPASPLPATARNLEDIIQDVARKNNIDADFIRSVIAAESGGKVKAVSRKGAQGLMQLMPVTATRLGVIDSFDPESNVEAGVRHLRQLLALYHNDVAKALAAYNAGALRVQQYRGIPPYRETRNYIRRIINDYNKRKSEKPQASGAGAPLPTPPASQNTIAD